MIFSYTSITPRLIKSPSLRTSQFAGKNGKDLSLECIPHLSSQADPSKISETSLCFAVREVSLWVLPKLLMESVQLSNLQESAFKVLVQPNKAFGLEVRIQCFQLFFWIKIHMFIPHSQAALRPSFWTLPCSQDPVHSTSLIWGSTRFTPRTESQGEGCWTENRAVPHFCQLHFCIYQLDWYHRLPWVGNGPHPNREWLLAILVIGISCLPLCYSGAVLSAVHDGHALASLLTPPDLF